ncbi:MAG: F0F1 ATP synthase subunit B [Candidatus Eisenbacteria bacterium]|nr:F0F1 ATP synthase subunit B [Candidatus Eisenbacteria bacterium]
MAAEVNVLNPHWSEVATHAVAFAFAVAVLRRYAWKPILGLLEERRAKIVSDFDAIEKGKTANAQIRAEYERELKTIDQQARAKIQEAVGEGQRVAGEIREHARQESRELMQRAKEEIEIEKDKAEVALKEDMVRMSLTAAEKLLRSKLDDATHRRLISDAIDDMMRMQLT